MKRLVPVLLLILVCGVALGGGSASAPSPASCKEPENHKLVVDRLLLYHDSGEYDREIRDVANSARDYLNARVKCDGLRRGSLRFCRGEPCVRPPACEGDRANTRFTPTGHPGAAPPGGGLGKRG